MLFALLCLVCGCEREKVRPAALWSSCKREKVRPAHEKWPKMGVLCRAGRVFRGNAAGGAVPGEFFRGPAVVWSRRASLFCRAPGSRALLLAPL